MDYRNDSEVHPPGTQACRKMGDVVDSYYKILKGQQFTALHSASPELHSCSALTSMVIRGVSVW